MLARRQRQFWPRGGRAEPATTGLADVVKNKPQYGDILRSFTGGWSLLVVEYSSVRVSVISVTFLVRGDRGRPF